MRKSLILAIVLISSSGFAQLTGSLTVTPDSVYAGELINIRVEIRNNFRYTIEDITVSIDFSGLASQQNYTIPALAPDAVDVRNIELQILPSAQAGSFQIAASAVFGAIKTDLAPKSLSVSTFPVELNLQLEKETIAPSEYNSLTVQIKNTGNENLYDVEVLVELPYGFEMNGSSELPISILTPTQAVSKVFTFRAPARISGQYHIDVLVQFYDSENKKHEFSRGLTLNAGAQFGFGWLETLLTIIIILLVVRIFWRRFR